MSNPSNSRAVPVNRELIDNAFQAILGQGPDGLPRFVQTDTDGNLAVSGAFLAVLQETMRVQVVDLLSQMLAAQRVNNILVAQAAGITDDLDRMYDEQLQDVIRQFE